jgi:hypothetical protein
MRSLSGVLETGCTMTLKKLLLFAGVAVIPGWYLYRTVADQRVPRLAWNEIFMPEDERLRKELKTANEKAERELARIAAENAPAAMRTQAAQRIRVCIQWADNIEAAHRALIEEQSLWPTEVEALLRSPAGVPIATNPDYVRAFRKFHEDLVPESYLKEQSRFVEEVKQNCQALSLKNPLTAALDNETRTLDYAQKFYDENLKRLKWGRLGIRALVQLANKQVPDSLDAAILQQRVDEAVRDFRPYGWRR